MTQLASWGRLGGVALAAYALDLLTKMMAERSLTLHEPVPLIGQFFRLTLGYNTGVAFSLFADSGPAAGILSGLIILGILVWVGLQIRADRMLERIVAERNLFQGSLELGVGHAQVGQLLAHRKIRKALPKVHSFIFSSQGTHYCENSGADIRKLGLDRRCHALLVCGKINGY